MEKATRGLGLTLNSPRLIFLRWYFLSCHYRFWTWRKYVDLPQPYEACVTKSHLRCKRVTEAWVQMLLHANIWLLVACLAAYYLDFSLMFLRSLILKLIPQKKPIMCISFQRCSNLALDPGADPCILEWGLKPPQKFSISFKVLYYYLFSPH